MFGWANGRGPVRGWAGFPGTAGLGPPLLPGPAVDPEGAVCRSPFGTRMRGTGEYARQIDGPPPSRNGRMTSGRSRIMWIEGLGSDDPRIGR